MRRRWPPGVAALLAATGAVSAACDGAPPGGQSTATDSIVVVDAEGQRLALARPARRIVSLVPSATSTLDAIGARDALVGRTDYDVQPWASDLPSVGGGLEPSLEALVALEPDLVVRFGGDQDPRTRDRLDDLGIAHLSIRPDRLENIYEAVRMLGIVTGHESSGDSLALALESGLDSIARSVADRPRLRVVYVLGGTPPWVSGPGTFIHEVLERVGGDNVFSDLGVLYRAVSPEELLSRRIDVVLVSDRSQIDSTLTPGARIVEVGNRLDDPGPGVLRAAREVAELLHGPARR